MPLEVTLQPFPVFGDTFAYYVITQIAQRATFSNQAYSHVLSL